MGTAMRGGRAGPSSLGRPITGAAAGQDAQARPMTAVRAAGYTAAGKRGKNMLIEVRVGTSYEIQ